MFYVVTHYDKVQDGKLSYKEFLSLILPLNNLQLRFDASQREPYRVPSSQSLPQIVEWTLARII